MKKILIVDDEPDITEIIHRYAQKIGYSADTSHSWDDVLRQVESNDYWAIFCDLKMPGINGLEIFDRLQSRRSKRPQRFVLLTGMMLDRDTETMLAERNILLFKKPFNFREFTSMFTRLEATSDRPRTC